MVMLLCCYHCSHLTTSLIGPHRATAVIDGDDIVLLGYYRRGDLTTSLMPATYFVHGLAGYPPAVMSAHTLPTAAFLSAGVDPVTYATMSTYGHSAAGAAQMRASAYDMNVGSDAATTSELSPGSTQNGVVESNGAGNYMPPGYGSYHIST